MKKKLFSSALVSFCFIFLITIAVDLNGKWRGVFQTPDGTEVEATYTFKVEGDKFSGTAESAGSGVLTIENGKISGNDFSFTLNIGGSDFLHAGKVYADSCSMDIDFSGTKVHTTIKRVKG